MIVQFSITITTKARTQRFLMSLNKDKRELVLTHESASTMLNNNIHGNVPVSLNFQQVQKIQTLALFML